MMVFMLPATILSHTNVKSGLPKLFDWVIITPQSHRIHHSLDDAFSKSNFGGFTLFWDVIFGTYTPSNSVEILSVGVKNRPCSASFFSQFSDFLRK
jgi:sterol desaturase/sphingolipid hydroxylase (fatty acid hydroxylase superfamily)